MSRRRCSGARHEPLSNPGAQRPRYRDDLFPDCGRAVSHFRHHEFRELCARSVLFVGRLSLLRDCRCNRQLLVGSCGGTSCHRSARLGGGNAVSVPPLSRGAHVSDPCDTRACARDPGTCGADMGSDRHTRVGACAASRGAVLWRFRVSEIPPVRHWILRGACTDALAFA